MRAAQSSATHLDRFFGDPSWPTLFANKHPRIVGRALTLIESGVASSVDLLELCGLTEAVRGRTIGITGPPGAGKSTIINALIEAVRARSATIAVIAVDPSSPHSGGALLGDRIRMTSTVDRGLFIRSLASRGHLGGTVVCASDVISVLSALFDYVLIETVGTGQSEVELQALAGTCVMVCIPGLGDEIQMSKAGILEIADILVVNQADRPGAADTARQLRDMIQIRSTIQQNEAGGWVPPVLKTIATSGQGVDALLEACARHAGGSRHPHLSATAARRALESLLAGELLAHFSGRLGPDEWHHATKSFQSGQQPERVIQILLRRLTSSM